MKHGGSQSAELDPGLGGESQPISLVRPTVVHTARRGQLAKHEPPISWALRERRRRGGRGREREREREREKKERMMGLEPTTFCMAS
jgi:hypothetical protein